MKENPRTTRRVLLLQPQAVDLTASTTPNANKGSLHTTVALEEEVEQLKTKEIPLNNTAGPAAKGTKITNQIID